MASVNVRGLVATGTVLCLCSCTGTITSPGSEREGAPEEEDSDPWPEGPDAGGAPAEILLTFAESDADFLNPERGFYTGLDLLDPGAAASLREEGHTLAIAIVRLDDYRDRPLDEEILTDLDEGFAAARAAGVKVILRFAYNASFDADAPKERILQHIAQLSDILQANDDVIAVLQAGFIGAWGEWHGSTHGLDNNADRTDVLEALLDALPERRTVQVRAPMYKAAALPGGPLTVLEAWTASPRARVGHHNDCFLASEDDLGTYADPVPDWRAYTAADTRFTPMGGETCLVNDPRTDCASAVEEMASYHWSYLNRDYKQEVISEWISQGCEDEIRRRLGYRFALVQAAHSEEVPPGGVLELDVRIANRGFAAPFNPRPVFVALTGEEERQTVRLAEVDARRWRPGETTVVSARLRIPTDAAPGTYSISLWLPDETPYLAPDPRYAIRMANEGVWDPVAGDNVLTRELRIDPGAPGEVDPFAAELVQL